MPDGPHGEYRRRRRTIRGLMALVGIVVLVDIAAIVLTLIGNGRVGTARAEVTAGLSYQANTDAIMQDAFAAESAVRGYLLTGDRSYIDIVRRQLVSAPAQFRAIRRGSRGDPVLRRDFRRLQSLAAARGRELAQTYGLEQQGHHAAAIKVVKTGLGNRLTQQIRTLILAMNARSAALVSAARRSARSGQAWANRANVAAYVSSALLLIVMLTLFRTYVLTEAARRESRLAQLEAERLNMAKSNFLSRVSHELRTPLNAILGFGQLLERDLIEAGELETLEQMLAAGRHLLAIVDDLLDLSRIESGGLRLSLEPVQLGEAITEARSLISPAATAAAVGVRQRPLNADLYVRADRGRLIQVLLNLLSNAVKYNRRGGNVVISAGRTDGGGVRIEVADTGAGISSAAIGRLFEPFERLDAASRGIEGTGLGLALARGLVESMGGTLELRSEEGVGTTVVFELPGASAAEATAPDPTKLTAAAAAAVPAAAASRLRAATSVLYIEDNPSNVRLVEKIFGLSSDLGLSVAREGSEGVALARELRPDLILLDLHLPDMPGEQVLAALRGDERLAQTPVIIVSADASPLQAKRLLAAGADGYLTKPFDIDQLLAAVRTRGTAAPVEAQELSDGLVDAPMAASLHVLSGNPAVGPAQIGQMLETFHSDARAMLRSLHEAADEPNLAAVEREAHRLAGGAGAVAAGRFRGLCKEIENHARQGDRDRVRELDAGLDELYEQTWEALTREFAAELRQLPAAAEQRPAG